MTKEQFLEGRPFTYTGHFQMLKRHPLYFDAALTAVVDDETKEVWEAPLIGDINIALFKPCYGSIIISYNECRLKEPVNTND